MGNLSSTNAASPDHAFSSDAPFSRETLVRLQAAIDTDDIIDPHAIVPASFLHECSDATVHACYALCVQFWLQWADRDTMARVVGQILRGEPVSDADRHTYKQIRASFKHLRFAQRLYLKRHKTDLFLWWITGKMGDLQDAHKNQARRGVLRHGIVLRLLLTRPIWAWVRRRAQRDSVDSAAGLLSYRHERMQRLEKKLAAPLFTGTQFHSLRKIVSQQVSYYDTLYALQPDEDLLRAMRYAGNINGVMGARHDDMVAASLSGTRDYETRTPMDTGIRDYLETFTRLYPH